MITAIVILAIVLIVIIFTSAIFWYFTDNDFFEDIMFVALITTMAIGFIGLLIFGLISVKQ